MRKRFQEVVALRYYLKFNKRAMKCQCQIQGLGCLTNEVPLSKYVT